MRQWLLSTFFACCTHLAAFPGAAAAVSLTRVPAAVALLQGWSLTPYRVDLASLALARMGFIP
jgi:hypothetical protein